ncbi:MAG: hypothetical protein PHQ81_06820 [Methanofollis sp.]|nr:hypothetical protein [Methanofollis sp.]
MKTIVLKGAAKETQSVHSSVRLPADVHAYAKRRGINLSKTLAATIAAFRDEERENGTGKTATNLAPVPAAQCNPRENHDDTSPSGGMGK